MDFSARYRELTGRFPDVVTSAPAWADVLGIPWDVEGGQCLAVPLPWRTSVAAAPRTDRHVVVHGTLSRQRHLPVVGRVHRLVSLLRERGIPVPGLDLVVEEDLPLGAGPVAETALDAAAALAASAVAQVMPPRQDLLDVCLDLARELDGDVAAAVGITVALLGQQDHALLYDAHEERFTLHTLPSFVGLLMVDTGVVAGDPATVRANRLEDCHRAADQIGVLELARASPHGYQLVQHPVVRARARHLISEQRRITRALTDLRRGAWEELGPALTASHTSLRQDFGLSHGHLDLAVDAAVGAGAWGARLVSGGLGGCVLVLVRKGREQQVQDAVLHAFATERFEEPLITEVSEAGPARLEVTQRSAYTIPVPRSGPGAHRKEPEPIIPRVRQAARWWPRRTSRTR